MKKQKKVSAQCASCESWMTALFDGQATPSEMATARTHLKECVFCKRVWREWSRTRSLLRAAPTPAPPAALADQVILACRLMPSLDAKATSALERSVEREELARYLNATDLEYSGAPLTAFFEQTAAPDELKQKILQLTVNAQVAPAKRRLPRLFVSPFLLLAIQSSMESVRAWNAPRWGFSLAVPATAVWVLMAGSAGNLNPSAEAPIAVQSAPRVNSLASITQFLPQLGAQKSPVKSLPKIASAKSVVTAEELASSREAVESPEVSAISVESHDSNNEARGARLISTIMPSNSAISKNAGLQISEKKKTEPVKIVKVPRIKSRPRLGFVQTPRNLVRASFSSARTSFRRLSNNVARKVSTIDNVEPRMATVALERADFDETLVSVNHMTDDRPEDLGAAVDEYRASLLDENNGEDVEEWEDEEPSEDL